MNKSDKIYVAGHNGLIGSAIVRRLENDGYTNIITRSHSELDLTDQSSVKLFFERERPDYVFFAAGKVGGVFANNVYRADFIYENLIMQCNVIHHSFLSGVKQLLFFGSADIYPKNCPQPAKEDYLLSGYLESTSEPFSVAKIAGIKMCESYNRQYGTNFIVVIPPNVYGPNQHYDIMNAQVLPSLIKRFHEAKTSKAKEVVIWGSGSPIRDFLYVDDVVDACIFLIENPSEYDVLNIGTGKGYAISELAKIIRNEVGYEGEIVFDKTRPDGVPIKLLDVARMNGLGWRHKTGLVEGVRYDYKSYISEIEKKNIRISKIYKAETCKKDIVTYEQIRSSKSISLNEQPENYVNRVVLKPWGYEYLIFENDCVAVWLLHIKKGYSTSMHCHPMKKTALILLSGNAMCNTFESRNYLKGGDALVLDKGVFHSTKSLSDAGIFLLEIESPPFKTDLIRLEDRYGRESSGYEGITEMESQSLESYGYFYFEEADSFKKLTYSRERFDISFEVYLNNNEFRDHFRIKEGEILTSCRGSILDENGNLLIDVGDNQKADILSNMNGLHISEKTVLLRIMSKDK